MLKKNADYSGKGDNISITGKLGVSVRMLDKASRYFNLLQNKDQKVKDESRQDTLTDIINYAVIALMLENEEWGNFDKEEV